MEFDLKQENDAVYRYRLKTGKEGDHDRGPQIVFIHGLQPEESRSPYFEPWLTEDGRELWPKSWLSESFPTATMYLVHYDSCPRKDGKRGMMDMFVAAEYLLQNLLLANVGQSPRNPVILVGHDIGGLVIKYICLQAFSGASSDFKTPMDYKKRQFLRQVKGVFYFSTPHGGFHYWDPEHQGELMANLTVHNVHVARSNEAFRKMRMKYKWRAYGLGASHSLPGQVEVKEASGRYDVDEFFMIGASSMNICRFKDSKSTSFQILVNFIQDTVCGFKNPNRVELRFKDDLHYVPLKRTVHQIKQKLECPDIQVVVLWGDAGTGKSCLVKYLALQYEKIGSNAAFWDGIFYFDCYHQTDLEIMQQMLREVNKNEETISANGEDQNPVDKQLRNRLQNLNALMVLDDVSDHRRSSLVEKVVFPGAKDVKYLITSQQSDVWKDYARCKIEKVNLKVARKILFKNIRDAKDDIWREQNIPKEDEEIVNQIIHATDFHPLALATIAISVEVDTSGRVPRAEWQELKRNLFSYLGDEDEGARARAFEKLYPVTVYAAMMNAVDVLYDKKDGKDLLHLLCILALFKGPLLTSVFHMFILCTSEPPVSSQVTRLVKRLQGRGLVQNAWPLRFSGRPMSMYPTDDSRVDLPGLKLHSLRQQFILRCADLEFHPKKKSQPSVEFIKGILKPFLSRPYLNRMNPFEGEEHWSGPSGHIPSALRTVFCVVYGVSEVSGAALDKLRYIYRLKSTFILNLPRPMYKLNILLWRIEELCTSQRILLALQKVVSKYIFQSQMDHDNVCVLISEGYYGALRFLIDHLTYIDLLRSRGERPRQMITESSMLSYVVIAIKLLRTEVQLSRQTLLHVLTLLALQVLALDISESYPCSIIDACDLEVLINVLLDPRVQSPELSFHFPWTLIKILDYVTGIESVKFRWISLLRTRPSLQKVIESFIERSAAYLNSGICDESAIEWLAADMSSGENDETDDGLVRSAADLGNDCKRVAENFRVFLESSAGDRDLGEFEKIGDDIQRTLEKLKVACEKSQVAGEKSAADMNFGEIAKIEAMETIDPIIIIIGTLDAVKLLSELETFGEEKVAATIKSISKHIQALARSFEQKAESFRARGLILFQSIISAPVQGIRSVVWSIPGVIESIVSVVCSQGRPSPPESTCVALPILLDWIHLDDGARSRLISRQDFLDVLLEIIRNHRGEKVHPLLAVVRAMSKIINGCSYLESNNGIATLVLAPLVYLSRGGKLPHCYAVQILEAFLTSDINGAAAESDWASLLDMHPALSDLLVRYTDEESDVRLRRSVLTILLHLGYNLFERNDTTSCSHIRAVTPQHFQRTDVKIRSRALIVQRGLENLLDVILKGQSKVERVTAADLLSYLCANYSSMRARVCAVPEAATGLARLLNDDGVDVQTLALQTIMVLFRNSETDLAMGFIRQIALVSGVVERIIEFTRDDWGVKPILAMGFVEAYLHAESGNFPHISSVRDMVQDMVTWMKNKRQNAFKISGTLQFLNGFSRDTSNLSFFLSIRGSVKAVVELVAHYTQELQLDGSEKERTERVNLIEKCFILLRQIANASEEANFQIARSGRLLDLTLDLLDERQRESVQVGSLIFLADLAKRSPDAVFEMMERPKFIEKLSFLLHSVDGEKWIWLVTEFAFRLARLGQNVLPEKIVELLWSVLEDIQPTEMDGAYVTRGLESLLSLVRNHKPSGHFLAPEVLERLISLSLHHPQGSARAKALLFLCLSLCYVSHYEVFSLFLFKVLDALPGILSQLERPDSVVVQGSIVQLLKLLVCIEGGCENEIKGSSLRRELVSLTLYNSRVLENLTGLLQRDEPECRHEDVMIVLYATARRTNEGMFRIVGIPGTLERIVELVYRANTVAFDFLLKLIISCKLRASAPRYLLKCLVHVATTSKAGDIAGNQPVDMAGRALRLLELCAWQNKYALRYLVDILHKNIRYKLRAEAMNYLVRCVSDSNQEPLGRTVFVSLRNSDYDLVIDENSDPVYYPYSHMAARRILDALVSKGRHHRLRLAKCVTGMYAYDLQMKTIDAPTVKKGSSTASSEGLHHGFVPRVVRRLAKHTRPGLLSILDSED